MGPPVGSPEYKQQVGTIVAVCCNVPTLTKIELNEMLMLYIQDTSYSRAAIAEAEKEIRRQRFLV